MEITEEQKKELEKQRIIKAIEYYWEKKPSEFSMLEQRHFVSFLKLLKAYINGEEVHTKVLRETSRYDTNEDYDAAKEIFQ